MCWDVLHIGDTSVTARPLNERQALLRQTVRDAPAAGIRIGALLSGLDIKLLESGQRLKSAREKVTPPSSLCR